MVWYVCIFGTTGLWSNVLSFFSLPFGIMGSWTNGLTVERYIFQAIEVFRMVGRLVFLQL